MNNQYVLNLPNDNNFSNEEIEQATNLISEANKIVFLNNAVIDTQTKVASMYPIQTRSYGKNDIQIHWNYARIYLDKGQAKALMAAAISDGSTALGGFFGNVGGAAAGAAIGAYLSSVVGSDVKSGVWLDFNYFSKSVNNWGWQ
ncbi:hypothetical protein ACFP1L_03095 [Lactiplantibacillus nangangensis]|uniref:Uncharacterized protein n=1 Tax=Lactiplantibacillus nangangensis TaxID=2559917 RepID=A0ABW1SH62_9LACO|nr:hypothetical protein [Lactiplantibacillus nangangensis]